MRRQHRRRLAGSSDEKSDKTGVSTCVVDHLSGMLLKRREDTIPGEARWTARFVRWTPGAENPGALSCAPKADRYPRTRDRVG